MLRKSPKSLYPIRSVFWKRLNKRPPELDVGSVCNQRFDFFAFFFFVTFLAVFFFPTAFRPADDLVFFAGLLEDFFAAFLAAFFAVFATVFTAVSAKAPAA